MVSSGLSVRTEVAQERLAIHLLIAAGTVRDADLRRRRLERAAARTRRAARVFAVAAGLFAALVYRPARPRGAGRGPAGRADLQYLAADGRPVPAGRGLPLALAARAPRRRRDRAVRAPDRSPMRSCLRAGAGVAALRSGFRRLRGARVAARGRRARCRSRSGSRHCCSSCRSGSRLPIRRWR